MKHILVASDKRETCEAIHTCFDDDFAVDVASSMESCLEIFQKRRYEFTFIDVELLRRSISHNEDRAYQAALQPFWHAFPTAEIIVMSSHEMIREAVMAVKAGASNYLTYPVDQEEVRYVVQSVYEASRTQSELDYLRDDFWKSDARGVVQTNSSVMRKVFDKVRAVAPTKSTVLLTGETGTGKGLMAKLIHTHSHRSDRQFISVHCGAIPDTLLESELFGHERGAFTGAVRRKLGKFEIAHGGTLFLDEIGTITPSAQIKLLQVLQERSFQRVGGEATIEVDVRIIAATNMDLERMSDKGLFRKDLYYRLSVFPIEIPPLRERKEDIRVVSRLIFSRLNKFHGRGIHDIDPGVLDAFDQYLWPGNIRELENLMERAYILETSSILSRESFPAELFPSQSVVPRISTDSSRTLEAVRGQGIEEIERQYLKEVLSVHKGRINESAKRAGVSVRQLHNLLKKYGIRKEDFKSPDHRRHEPKS
jgi:DNA-binding NtrC family response regulator